MKKKIIIIGLVIAAIILIIICIKFNKKTDNVENTVQFDENNIGYKFEESNLYVQLNKETWVKVPGDFSQMIEKSENKKFKEGTYQISDYKIVFYYTTEHETGEKYNKPTKYSENGSEVLETEEVTETKYNSYLIYSDDDGKTWNTIQSSPVDENTQYMHFVDSQIGYVANVVNSALGGVRLFELRKTEDGGKTWQTMSNFEAKSNSKMNFIKGDIGFYTVPFADETESKLYMTSDAGKTWKLVTIIDSEIYDYYNTPELEGERLKLVISQGNDGDYNGGDTKQYYSDDYGITWNVSATN